jgi:CRISPR-associated endonuclease Cas3-HD
MSECWAFLNVESYLKHIYATAIIWERILSKYYLNSVKRILGTNEDLVRIAILYHDLGKLTKEYREGNRRLFRHEIIGAYLAYKNYNNLYLSLAILLHHEPFILGIYAGSIGEKFITLSTLRRIIEKSDLSIYCDLTKDPWYNKSKEIYNNKLDEVVKNLNSINKEDIYNKLKEIVIKSSISTNELLEVRIKVAALLYPLTLVDSLAALFTRKDSNDAGTWITKRALDDDPRAEIPKRNEIYDLLIKEKLIEGY